MFQTVSMIFSRGLIVGAMAVVSVSAVVPQAGAEPSAAKRMQAEWMPARDPHYWHHDLLRSHCSAAYPMHHGQRCGTATGGPAGGLN